MNNLVSINWTVYTHVSSGICEIRSVNCNGVCLFYCVLPLDLSTPTGMSCIGTYGENCKSDNVSKYHVLLVAFLLLWHEN